MVYNYYIDTGVGGTKPAMTYKEQQQIDQAKRMEENKKKDYASSAVSKDDFYL
ncbi:MAG: hypothetical protein S4CHLAM27_12330 [Chlamydiia bacterium]|nr:hypothetical protein [Chlamydiia bacterium]